jgi:hypothetical protein
MEAIYSFMKNLFIQLVVFFCCEEHLVGEVLVAWPVRLVLISAVVEAAEYLSDLI